MGLGEVRSMTFIDDSGEIPAHASDAADTYTDPLLQSDATGPALEL